MSIKIMRGYPGSGKSTRAKTAVGEDETHKTARVSRDDMRAELFGYLGAHLPYEQEQEISKLQRNMVVGLVKSGYDVIVDDLNLKLRYARAWADLAVELGVEFLVEDVETPLLTCIALDAKRAAAGGRSVGEKGIRDLAARFPLGRWPEVKPTDKATGATWPVYTPDTSLPEAIIVDIDGTIAAKKMGPGERGWHEYHRVGEDDPKDVILDIVDSIRWLGEEELYGRGGEGRNVQIIFVSGRKESCRDQTVAWLADHLGKWAAGAFLFMRATDDNRADDVVKNELFEHCIAHSWNVLFTIDDRQRVVDMWRAKGITCLQVDAWEEAGK